MKITLTLLYYLFASRYFGCKEQQCWKRSKEILWISFSPSGGLTGGQFLHATDLSHCSPEEKKERQQVHGDLCFMGKECCFYRHEGFSQFPDLQVFFFFMDLSWTKRFLLVKVVLLNPQWLCCCLASFLTLSKAGCHRLSDQTSGYQQQGLQCSPGTRCLPHPVPHHLFFVQLLPVL